MILETDGMERTLISLVPMQEIVLPEVDVQGKEVPRGMDDQEETLLGGVLQGEVLRMTWMTAIQVKITKMTSLRLISEETPLNIPKHMGLEPDITTVLEGIPQETCATRDHMQEQYMRWTSTFHPLLCLWHNHANFYGTVLILVFI